MQFINLFRFELLNDYHLEVHMPLQGAQEIGRAVPGSDAIRSKRASQLPAAQAPLWVRALRKWQRRR